MQHQVAIATPAAETRDASMDNLKVALVIGVIVGHATFAWTDLGLWVFSEPALREPWLSLATMAGLVGGTFGMAAFFFIAGLYTVPSLARKGFRRFLVDRTLRLGIPMLFFIIFLSPFVEYADPDAAGWDRGFGAFALHTWWPPVPGPTWFLGVLLFFSAVYAVIRAVRPRRLGGDGSPLRVWHLVVAMAVVAAASYLVRIVAPLGTEVWHLAVAQAPAWTVGFGLGVIGRERNWFHPIPDRVTRFSRRIAWAAVVTLIAFGALAADLDRFAGSGTPESMLAALIEGVLAVAVPLWLVDLFRRRFDTQRRLGREMGRAAFAAFVIHQLVLVGLVLASRRTPWYPEIEYLLVSALGVAGSFYAGWLLLRIPGVSRVV